MSSKTRKKINRIFFFFRNSESDYFVLRGQFHAEKIRLSLSSQPLERLNLKEKRHARDIDQRYVLQKDQVEQKELKEAELKRKKN